MDFARKQLEKYGWKEGDGLGKEGNEGITKAIKPHYKSDKTGMGFELGKELTDTWWTRSYDDCLKAINVEGDNDGESVTVSRPGDGASGSREPTIIEMRRRLHTANFRDFSKGGTLTQGELVPAAESNSEEVEKAPTKSKISQLTDEELFQACGGRTAHKGARHGFKLTGKLKRLAEQDKYLLANPEALLPKAKKSKKNKKSKKSKSDDDDDESL